MKTICTVLFFCLLSISAFAQSKFSLGVNGEVAIPMDLFGDAVNTGFGGNVYGSYNLNENIDLSLSAGYLTWAVNDEDIKAAYPGFPDISFSAIPIVAGIKYYFSQGSIKPYAGLEVGLHIINHDSVTYDMDSETFTTESVSGTKAGWGIGLGILAALSETVDLDVSAKLKGNGFEVVKGDEDSGNYEKATILFFGINAGVKIKL